jgi:hypothetical protein
MAGQDHRSGHVHVHERDHVLRVRVGHHPVRWARGADLLLAAFDGKPGEGVLGGDAGHRRQQARHLPPVLLGREAEACAARDVEDREGQIGLEDLVGDLSGMEGIVEGRRATLGRPEAPFRPAPLLLEPLLRGERFPAHDDGGLATSCEDLGGRLLEHVLWRRSAEAGEVTITFAEAEPFGQAPRGVVVLPAQAVDHVQAVDGSEHGRRPAVRRRLPADLFPLDERLGRLPVIGTMGALGAADQARGSRIHHLPFHTGARFSAKALGPSFASSLWNTRLLISVSTA